MADSPRYVLLLEDDEERITRFRSCVASLGTILEVRTWDSAFLMISQVCSFLPHAEFVSLDHDLEPKEGEPDPGDGYELAKFLTAQPVKLPVIIHSSNSDRVRWMEGEFELAQWPFWRVPPFGEDWIETIWMQTVKTVLNLT